MYALENSELCYASACWSGPQCEYEQLFQCKVEVVTDLHEKMCPATIDLELRATVRSASGR